MTYKIKPTDMVGSLNNGFGYRNGCSFGSTKHWKTPNKVVKTKVINSKLIQEMYK